MQKKTKVTKKQSKTKKIDKKKLLIISVSVFAVAVLTFGIVFGSIAISKEKNSIASFRGVRMDREVAVYFASVFKSKYKASLAKDVSGVEDSPGFWNSTDENGTPYIDMLRDGAKEEVRKILVMNYLFDKYSSLSASDKKVIKSSLENTLKNYGGSVELFNEAASKYEFDYDSYAAAVEMLYKAEALETILCGENGSKLKASTDANVIASRNRYLSNYSHVKLLYINTERTFVLDENGNRVSDGSGGYKIKELSYDEKAERLEQIENIRSAIAAIGTDGVQMGPDMFENYMYSELYAGMLETREHGYYFLKGTKGTAEFDNQSVVDKALEMKVSEFAEVEVDGGVCFIYKMPVEASDLSVSALESYFEDFYLGFSGWFVGEQVAHFTPAVKVKDEFDEIDLIVIPYNSEIRPSFKG